MEFSRLLDKIGRGQRLSENELAEMRNHARDLEDVKNAVKGWMRAGDSTPTTRHMESYTGYFWDVPLNTIQVQRVGIQAIDDDSLTAIEWDDLTANTASLRVDPNDWAKIIITPGKRYGFIGTVEWEQNGTGRRAATMSVYDKDDVLLYGQTLHSLLPTNLDADTIPIADATQGLVNAAYIKFFAYQSSGGALDLQSARLAIFEIMGEKPA
jgi:hypothetical protein